MQVRLFASLLLAGISSIHTVHAQSWNYQAFGDRNQITLGHITLEQKDGAPKLQFFAPRMDACWTGELDATVTRTESSIVVTPAPRIKGCQEIRVVLKADGSGGVREEKRGNDWVPDGRERLLTLRK